MCFGINGDFEHIIQGGRSPPDPTAPTLPSLLPSTSNPLKVHSAGRDPITEQTGQKLDTDNCREKPIRPMLQLQLLPGAISAMFADATETKTLTEADRYGLLAAILTEDIEDEERRAVDRILRSVRRGKLAIA
ncbi:MAG: hypothetical protein ACPGVO_00100 [Spirulinaceae cyanobacterium]